MAKKGRTGLIISLAGGLIFNFLIFHHAYAITVEKIVKNMIEANKKVFDYTTVQEISMQNPRGQGDSMEMKETSYAKLPDKKRIEMEMPMGKQIMIFNRDESVMLMNGMIMPIPRDKKNKNEIIFSRKKVEDVLAGWKEQGIDIAVIGEDKFKGKSAYIIGARKGRLDVNQWWIDKSRWVPLRMIARSEKPAGKPGEIIMDMHLLDYQKKKGMWYPSITKIYWNKNLFMTSKLISFQVNSGLEEDLFDTTRLKSQGQSMPEMPNLQGILEGLKGRK